MLEDIALALHPFALVLPAREAVAIGVPLPATLQGAAGDLDVHGRWPGANDQRVEEAILGRGEEVDRDPAADVHGELVLLAPGEAAVLVRPLRDHADSQERIDRLSGGADFFLGREQILRVSDEGALRDEQDLDVADELLLATE